MLTLLFLSYIFFYDLSWHRIQNWVLLSLSFLAIFYALIRDDLPNALLGGIVCLVAMLVIRLLARRGIGTGDIKMAGVMGLIVGFHLSWVAFILSWVIAAGAVLITNGTKITKGKTFPLGCSMSLVSAIIYGLLK